MIWVLTGLLILLYLLVITGVGVLVGRVLRLRSRAVDAMDALQRMAASASAGVEQARKSVPDTSDKPSLSADPPADPPASGSDGPGFTPTPTDTSH